MEASTLNDQMQKLNVNKTSSATSHQPIPDVLFFFYNIMTYKSQFHQNIIQIYVITPEYVKALTQPTDQFLCRISDNWPKLRFGGFKIRDMISGITLVEVQDDEVYSQSYKDIQSHNDLHYFYLCFQVDNDTLTDEDDPKTRVIKYHLGPDFLRLSTVGLTLRFSNGEKAINEMQMVERHYFRGKVIRSYEFKFGFVIPGSTNEIIQCIISYFNFTFKEGMNVLIFISYQIKNEWEFIYDLPELDQETKIQIVQAPWEVKSDSFFFADGQIIIHNRAEYNYCPLEDE